MNTKSKILDLPLKKEWYNMIESGEKKEEYREIKPYWIKRLTELKTTILPFSMRNRYQPIPFKKYDYVRFRYGYTNRTMEFKIEDITWGQGKEEWGAPSNAVFIIKLGERIWPAW